MQVQTQVRIEAVAYGHPDAVRMVEEVQEEYVARYGSRDESPVDPLLFTLPHGLFVIAYDGDEPLATGAWRRSTVEAFGTSSTAEIKRMYVVPCRARPGARAAGAWPTWTQTARAAGTEALVLETGLAQPEAIALYESSGYAPIAGFGYYCGSHLSRCFGKPLQV